QLRAAFTSTRSKAGSVNPLGRVECAWENLIYDTGHPMRGANDSVAIGQIAIGKFLGRVRSIAWIVLPAVAGDLFDDTRAVEAPRLINGLTPKTDVEKIEMCR